MTTSQLSHYELIELIVKAFPRPFRVNDIEALFPMITGETLNRNTCGKYLQDLLKVGSVKKTNFAGGATKYNFFCTEKLEKTIHIESMPLPLLNDRADPTKGSWGTQYSGFIMPGDLVDLASPVKYFEVASPEVVNATYNDFDKVKIRDFHFSPLTSLSNIMIHCFTTDLDIIPDKSGITIKGWKLGPVSAFQILNGCDVVESLTKIYVLNKVSNHLGKPFDFPKFPMITTIAVTEPDDRSVDLLKQSIRFMEMESEGNRPIKEAIAAEVNKMIKVARAQNDPRLKETMANLTTKEKQVKEQIHSLNKELKDIRKAKAHLLDGVES